MTRIQERHRLSALLAQGVDVTQPAAFVEVLAALCVEANEAPRAQAIGLLRSALPTRDDLDDHRYEFVGSFAPGGWRSEAAWLASAETIDLAVRAAQQLGDVLREDLVESLQVMLVETALLFDDARTWMNPLVAEESRVGVLPDTFPWNRIRSGVASGNLQREGPVEQAVLDAWLDDRLHAEDATALEQWVRETEAWREAYRARITELAHLAGVSRFDATRSSSVAADAAELEHAKLVQCLPLPHLGFRVRREGRLHAGGTMWGLRNGPASTDRLVPYGTARFEWSDEVLGEIVTELIEHPVDAVMLAEDALASVARLASGLPHPRARSIALAVAEDLRAGSLHDGLAAAARAFHEARLDADAEMRWAACALQTQLELERLAHRLSDADLDAAMDAAEAALMPHASGLLLLDDEHYRDLTDGYDVDPGAWWGARERLDEEVPTAVVANALDELAASAPTRRGTVISLSAYRTAVDHELRIATAPVERGLRAAAAAPRVPGEVDLLVTVENGGRVGRLLRVTVKRGEGDPFEHHPELAPIARDAIREAYAAAAAACPSGTPPTLLEDHAFVVHELLDITAIDGRSLGLPFVLAFASLWLDRPLDADLAATGCVVRGPGREWLVGAVDHVEAKAAALYAAADGRGRRLMANPEHEPEIRAFDHEPVLVSTVGEALRSAGLDLPKSNLPGAWPDRRTRLRAIADLADTIEAQDIQRFTAWGDPWTLLGDRMALLVHDLADDVDEQVPRGKVYGALAYIHAGKLDAAAALLRGVAIEHVSPEIDVVRRIVELDEAIDRSSPERCTELSAALATALAAVPEARRRPLAGLALGTLGRALLHAGDFDAAIPLLEEAVAHHAAHALYELGRTRLYLASALRNAGRLAEAREQLEHAERDLEAHTKTWSRPYCVQCRAFWLYERARLAIIEDDAALAVELAHEAHALVQRQGFWPALGILRVLAWAYRMLGQPDEADLYVARMQALDVPPAHHDLRDRLLAEASGLPTPYGEVY